ncbi:hypothetical protein BDZ89DRAFT_1052109 [Hymenopellis radicata]|nr:hypothetical protein BDZ89DRAFT_1052109 [Hymenopellis radicata]
MPAMSHADSVVLVTGTNGFIATWLVGELLKRGYSVPAAVRTAAKGKLKAGDAFNEAVKDVEGIIHAASPVKAQTRKNPTGIPKEYLVKECTKRASMPTVYHAAWDFMEKRQSEIKWDMVVINPSRVFGMLYGALVKEDFGGYPPLYAPGMVSLIAATYYPPFSSRLSRSLRRVGNE